MGSSRRRLEILAPSGVTQPPTRGTPSSTKAPTSATSATSWTERSTPGSGPTLMASAGLMTCQVLTSPLITTSVHNTPQGTAPNIESPLCDDGVTYRLLTTT